MHLFKVLQITRDAKCGRPIAITCVHNCRIPFIKESNRIFVFVDKIKLFAPSRLTLPGASNIRPELRKISPIN